MVLPLKFRKTDTKSLLMTSDVYARHSSSATTLRKMNGRTNSQHFILNSSSTKVKELLKPPSGKHQRTPSSNAEEIKNLSSVRGSIYKSSGDKDFDRLVSKMNYIHKIIVRKRSQAQSKAPTVPDSVRLSNKAIKRGLIVINNTIRGKAHSPVGF